MVQLKLGNDSLVIYEMILLLILGSDSLFSATISFYNQDKDINDSLVETLMIPSWNQEIN